jgi:Asp-tRNA(Asn)/Glu-tRNA(Gln) amidotransferase A subunit family amidase
LSLLPRRDFVAQLAAAGFWAPSLPIAGVLRSGMQEAGAELTAEGILAAAEVAGLAITIEQAEAMRGEVGELLVIYEEIDAAPLGNEVPLPLHFDPRVPGVLWNATPSPLRVSASTVRRPADLDSVAYWPIAELAHLIETRQVSCRELAEMYLGRLKRHGPALNCVVNLTEDRALAQAAAADAEIAAGAYRGPLHGIPYGVKDIIAARGYPTTWGAARFENRVVDEDATVIRRLDEAGAVLVAKLSTGELAFGDRWFRGRTNSPWNLDTGSSGSSAGSGAATAAGLVGFSIGSDTGGSILGPAQRCGVVGLRPTFGRVSRYGVMAAGTTLDKLGPMCRSAECAAIVLHAIAGPDDRDFSVPDVPVHWDAGFDPGELRLGYLATAFDAEEDAEYRVENERVLRLLRARWGELHPVRLPASRLNFFIEFVERAAAFSELLHDGLEDTLVRPRHADELRAHHLVPAVEYLQANRLRQRLMVQTHQALDGVDVVIAPYGVWWHPSRSLNALTSLTGHPVVGIPTTLGADGQPLGVVAAGRLYREGELLSVAQWLIEETGYRQHRPPRF